MSAASTTATRYQAARRRARPGRVAGRSGFYLLVGAFVVASLFPFYWIVITSLKTDGEISQGTKSLLPGHITWSNYANDLTKQDFVRPLINSVIVAGSTTILTVIIASLAGYALARSRIRGKQLIQGFLLVAGFFPVIAMIGPLFIAYRRIGLLDSLPGLVIAYLIYTLPLATWFLAGFFGQIPRELEEAAIVDGATRLQALRKVIIPVAVPGIFTIAILGFILCWNDFLIAVSFLTTPSKYTAPLAIIGLGQSQYQTFFNLIDAAVVMVTLPIALIMLFAQRRIISGLTAGSFR
jgi:ABC-type glycerol-3-phosphate transport system permease component